MANNDLFDEKKCHKSGGVKFCLYIKCAKCCGSYRSVKLSVYDMTVAEKIFKKWLRKQVEIDEIQMRFMSGKGTIDAIFSVR